MIAATVANKLPSTDRMKADKARRRTARSVLDAGRYISRYVATWVRRYAGM